MFVLTTVTRDCKNGDLYVSVDDNAYLTKVTNSTTRNSESVWQPMTKTSSLLRA